MKRWLITISYFILFTFHVSSQQLIFKTYTVEDGLVANPVRRILQDSKGFIWIGTWEGLSKYDGHKFTNYTTANGLSHNLVNAMYESPDGKLYLAENSGTVDILQHDAVFKKKAFQSVIINQFYVTQNNRVIAGTDTGGLYEIKNEILVKPVQKFSSFSYNDITDLNDSLLIGGAEGSILILNRQFELFAEIKKPHGYLTNKIYKDSKKRVWVGTNDGLKLLSIQETSNHTLSFTLLPAPFDLPALKNYIVNDIMEDDKANLWVGTSHDLIKIDPDGNCQLFSEKDGLPSSYIACIYEDREKNIWIGTSLGLVKLVTKNDIRIYAVEKGLGPVGFSFLLPVTGNTIFLTNTETGLQLFNSKTKSFTHISSSHSFYRGYVKNSRPALFYGDYFGFEKYDSAKQRLDNFKLEELPHDGIFCSVIDSNGIIFAGTQAGLFITSSKKIQYDNKLIYRITDLLIDKKGYLWIATWENGLYRAHYTVIKNKPGNDRINLSVQDFSSLLPDKNIRCMFEDSKGNLWIGTRYNGLVQLKAKDKDQYSAMQLDLGHGLMSNWIRAIAEDANGCIWVGSNLGIDKLIPSDSLFHVFNFSRVNNYFTSVNTILPADDHSLWFTTSSGLINVIDGETEKTPATPVYITSVELGDTSFNYNTYNTEKKLQLKYYQNQARFEFSAAGFINEKQILYSYRLLGSADTMWSKPANLHTVSYASLRPGNYQFQTRTIGWNGEWGESATFRFIIRLPFWKTWWFYSLLGLFMVLLFYSFYLYRIRQLLKLQKVRNRIASDLHDDIGARLTNIQILSALSEQKLDQPEQASLYLHRIVNEVQTSGEALDDIVWSINAKNDPVEDIAARMRRYIADIFEGDQVDCNMKVNDNISGIKLTMEKRRDLYLVFKEALNNIRKHSQASKVDIELRAEDNKVIMNIEDNGKGFDVNQTGDRNGLKNMKRRMEKWNGKVIIESTAGKGTKLQVRLPVNEASFKRTILNWLSLS
jgi:ligand-binding sensor domain-containing protein/two-component sensor histidine kinase